MPKQMGEHWAITALTHARLQLSRFEFERCMVQEWMSTRRR